MLYSNFNISYNYKNFNRFSTSMYNIVGIQKKIQVPILKKLSCNKIDHSIRNTEYAIDITQEPVKLRCEDQLSN